MKIANKNAVVTGGASGLGEATVRTLVAQGAKVTVLDVNIERGEILVEELGKDQVQFFKTDVTSESQVKKALAKAIKTLRLLITFDLMHN